MLSRCLVILILSLGAVDVSAQEPQPGEIVEESVQGINMCYIPGGIFIIGNDEGPKNRRPAHRVTLTPYLAGETEVTQAQYIEVVGENPSYFTGDYSLPVENVTWEDAAFFCNELSRIHGYTPVYDEYTWRGDLSKNGYRLLTEAEWEYACGAGVQNRWFYGGDESRLAEFAWYNVNSDGETHPVKQKQPNQFGLYDIYGNVEEWCHDIYADYPSGAVTNPAGPDIEGRHVFRGGHYSDSAKHITTAHRPRHLFFNKKTPRRGFRIARNHE